MSHFVQCDRCERKEHVLGTVALPPGWVKVLNSDLCEPCSAIVRDFIRFKPGDAANLPVEPVEVPCQAPPEPSATGEKLFETAPAPETKVETVLERVAEQVNSGALDTPGVKCTMTVTPASNSECSTEERTRTRKARKTREKLMGQDAILSDPRPSEPPKPKQTDFPHGHNTPGMQP